MILTIRKVFERLDDIFYVESLFFLLKIKSVFNSNSLIPLEKLPAGDEMCGSSVEKICCSRS